MHGVVERGDVVDELAADGLAAGLVQRLQVLARVVEAGLVEPEVHLDAVEAGELDALGLRPGLAVVDRRVEVAEGARGRLDALVVHARGGEEAAGEVVIAGEVGVDELLHLRLQLGRLRLDVGGVARHGRGVRLLVVGAHGHGVAGDGEGGRADARADHAGLADGEVVAGLGDDGEVARGARPDVLHLGEDREAVVLEDVELRHPLARVLDAEGDGAARRGRGLDGAARLGARDGDDRRGGVRRRVRHASRQRERERRDADGEGQDLPGHAVPSGAGEGETGDAARAAARRRPRITSRTKSGTTIAR